MTAVTTGGFGEDPTGPLDVMAAIDEIAACESPAVREVMIDDFLRATDSISKSIAAALIRDFKADRNTWLDDFAQCVRMAAHKLVLEMVNSDTVREEVGSYRGVLMFRAKSAVTAFVDSSAGFNQASKQAGLKRRIREMERTRAILFAELHREPTDDEIVTATNERMKAIRADYRRQGMECSTADLAAVRPSESIDDHHDIAARETVETDGDLHSTERLRLVITVIAACDAESAQLGQIARLWFQPALGDSYDGHPTAAAIARLLDIEPSTARHRVTQMRNIAQRVARERFGIRTDEGRESA